MSGPAVETPTPATPVEPEVSGFSLEKFYDRDGSQKAAAPKEPLPTPREVPSGESAVSATPEKSTSTSGPEESETSDGDKPMSKHEREKFKLRESKRRVEDALAKAEARAKELEERYGETPEQAPVDEAAQIRMEERRSLSREIFVERHGEKLMQEQFLADDSPWSEIEVKAKDGDQEALRMLTRAAGAKDPYQEAYNILGEIELFEHYGTRNLPTLLKKALAEQEATVKAAVLAELTPTRAPVGAAPATLEAMSGGNPPSAGSVPDAFSLSTYYQRK